MKLFVVILLSIFSIFQSKPLTEAQKINKLISYIESLQGASFIRNGDTHTCKEAAEHLRLKYKSASDKAKTAKDFINNLATKSSMSGKFYQIKLADGKVYKSQDLLLAKLKELEK